MYSSVRCITLGIGGIVIRALLFEFPFPVQDRPVIKCHLAPMLSYAIPLLMAMAMCINRLSAIEPRRTSLRLASVLPSLGIPTLCIRCDCACVSHDFQFHDLPSHEYIADKRFAITIRCPGNRSNVPFPVAGFSGVCSA